MKLFKIKLVPTDKRKTTIIIPVHGEDRFDALHDGLSQYCEGDQDKIDNLWLSEDFGEIRIYIEEVKP
jgi:hypothetical protein